MSKKHSDTPKFRSGLEKSVWGAAQRYCKNMQFEPHYLPYVIKGSYLPDILLPNGIYIEVKGRLDAGTQRKMRAVKQSNPDLDIRFVFQNANQKVRKGGKLRYWEWAEKYDYPWSEGTIPREWFEEESKY